MNTDSNRHDENVITPIISNVMICGKSGVGKTVLTNSLIGADVGETGVGKPVTENIVSYTVPGSPLVCYDTPGFEIKEGQASKAIECFCNIITSLQKTMQSNQMIDAIVYCISYLGKRFEDDEAKFIKRIYLDMEIPIYIVFTQYTENPNTWENDEINLYVKNKLENEGCVLPMNHYLPILCYEMSFRGGSFVLPAFGLDILANLLIEESALHAANKIAVAKRGTLKNSISSAKKWVIGFSAAAAGEAAIIAAPGADMVVLAANEAIMAGAIYDIMFSEEVAGQYDKKELVGIMSQMAIPLLGFISGPIIFNEVIKTVNLIIAPATGGLTVTGSIAIGAIVGFAVTYALGKFTIDTFQKLLTGQITMAQLKDERFYKQESKKIIKEQYKIGLKYAKEHPESIIKHKKCKI